MFVAIGTMPPVRTNVQLCSFVLRPSKPIAISYSLFKQSTSSFASLSEAPKRANTKKVTLTQEELVKINLTIPRLCLSDHHLDTAIQLTKASLLTSPPPKSISLSILIHSLTSQPDMSKPMSLLTSITHNPQAHPHLMPITTMLVTSYVNKKRPKEALKVYRWLHRPRCPCKVENIVYGVLVNGFCRFGLVLEALKVLRDMVGVRLLPGGGLRERVYRSLLREARVKQAVELNQALCDCIEDANGASVEKVVKLLESMIVNWTD
uniref:Pentatricopeptide repeat-containing protein n=1 Tax=Rhizophora mucronata TaxID=61149 RepID=A0A2P2K5V2_RHIMU